MTIRSLLPNTRSITGKSNFNFLNTTLLYLLFTGCTYLLITPSAVAQDNTQTGDVLPPPPPLSSRSRVIRGNRITRGKSDTILPPANVKPPTSYIGLEYTFSAPDTSKQQSAVNNIVTGYRVEVLGSSDFLLEQVRSIEPKAFSKGEIIQVGIFSEPDNAANLVRQLALQGLWARIVSK